ncbi:MAG: hypothetical protein RSC65_02760 [Malacoplasma sp.]
MKIFSKKILLGFAFTITSVFVIVPLASCSTAKADNSPETQPPPVEPPPPIVDPDPIPPPIVNPPPNSGKYDYQRFYNIKKAQFKDGNYAGLLDNGKIVADNQYAESNVHFVPAQVSKLPSLFSTDDILTLVDLKDVNVKPSSINILDYNDSLRTTGIQNWFEYETTHPSRIPHTDTSGRAKYKVVPIVDDTYKIKPGTTTTANFDYSYIDVQINFSTPNESVANHSFKHTFLFEEGINEVRYGNPPTQASQPLILTTDQKKVLGNDIKNQEFIVKKFTSETDHTIFNTDTLKHFVEIKHMKPSTSISESNSNDFNGVTKLSNPLPANLPYAPILKNETNRPVITVIRQTRIEIDATDKNEVQGKDSVKWHNFGKAGYKDTFHRGRSTYGGIGAWNNELTWAWTLS